MKAYWFLDGQQFSFEAGPFVGQLSAITPQLGIRSIAVDGSSLANWNLLGVDLADATDADGAANVDYYSRGGDVVATYLPSKLRNVRIQIYWRVQVLPWVSNHCCVIDLQVSAQTDLLDSIPLVATRSTVPSGEAISPLANAAVTNEGISSERAVLGAAEHCVILRPHASQFSYVEMIHPDDVAERNAKDIAGNSRKSQIGPGPTDVPGMSTACRTIEHRLFTGHLEKGVILRGRLRGVIAPRADDLAIAKMAFESFLRDPLPLTT